MIPALLAAAHAAPAPGYVDLHIHLAAHLAVPVYGTGPDRLPPARRTNKHGIQAQLFTEELRAPGPSILVSLAYANLMNAEFVSRRAMRAHIERQLAFVDAYADRHADRFGLARTPDEARDIVASGRTAIVHGIEGATKLLDDADDARAWADRGVAVITPVHLADNAIGGSWCQPGVLALLNVPGCWREAFAPRRHGLTPFGVARVGDLIDAGIVVDLAHMAHAAFAEAIPLLEARGVAPVFTHVTAAAVRRDPVALSDDELRQIYALGGLVGVTANLSHLSPKPAPPIERCPGSIDDLRLQWDHVTQVASGAPVAWGSDFQGGVDHPRPKYGPRGCEPAPPGADTFDVEGLVHAGLVEPMFAKLADMGADRGPLDASAERFLQIWERARAAAR